VYLGLENNLDAVVFLIHEGVIRPGTALPSSREMAALLDVHRKTIIAAYEELAAQDWITTVLRKGVMVSKDLPEIKPRSFKAAAKTPAYEGNALFNFSALKISASQMVATGHQLIINDGFPDARLAPVDLLLKEYNRLFHLPAMQRKIVYGDLAGALSLRMALAKFLAETRGLNISENNILITRGAQMAVYIAASMIIKPGSTVIVGEPNYGMANMLFEHCGAKLLRVPVDENGIDVAAIDVRCELPPQPCAFLMHHDCSIR